MSSLVNSAQIIRRKPGTPPGLRRTRRATPPHRCPTHRPSLGKNWRGLPMSALDSPTKGPNKRACVKKHADTDTRSVITRTCLCFQLQTQHRGVLPPSVAPNTRQTALWSNPSALKSLLVCSFLWLALGDFVFLCGCSFKLAQPRIEGRSNFDSRSFMFCVAKTWLAVAHHPLLTRGRRSCRLKWGG